MKNKFNKDIIETSIGASILPVGMKAIKSEGAIGSATSTVMSVGMLKKTGKKFGVL